MAPRLSGKNGKFLKLFFFVSQLFLDLDAKKTTQNVEVCPKASETCLNAFLVECWYNERGLSIGWEGVGYSWLWNCWWVCFLIPETLALVWTQIFQHPRSNSLILTHKWINFLRHLKWAFLKLPLPCWMTFYSLTGRPIFFKSIFS